MLVQLGLGQGLESRLAGAQVQQEGREIGVAKLTEFWLLHCLLSHLAEEQATCQDCHQVEEKRGEVEEKAKDSEEGRRLRLQAACLPESERGDCYQTSSLS